MKKNLKKMFVILGTIIVTITMFLYFYATDFKEERYVCTGNYLKLGEGIKSEGKAFIKIKKFGFLQSSISVLFKSRRMFGTLTYQDERTFRIFYLYNFVSGDIIHLNEIGDWSDKTNRGHWNYLSNNIFAEIYERWFYDGQCERDMNFKR